MILYNASSSYYSMIGRYALLEAGVPFESRRMDIHLAKEQLSDWYVKINPAMTVPSLLDHDRRWTDSQSILKYAAIQANQCWMDSDTRCVPCIEEIIREHYAIPIERLTFGKALHSIPPLKLLVFKMLGNAIHTLEAQLSTSVNKMALKAKINLNNERLAYFSEGNLADKLQVERIHVQNYLKKLPTPKTFLFGDKPSSADIVTVVLLSRLKMIREFHLVQSSDLINWFQRMKMRASYKKADIWTYFQPWRILLKR